MTSTIGTRRAVFLAAALYLVLPGPSGAFFTGVPLGLGASVALAVGVFAWVFFRSVPEPSRGWPGMSAALLALCAIKAGTALIAPPVGWVGRYYPNDRFAEPYRRSTDFPGLDATRIDRAIDFRDDQLPVYFLNEADFNRDIRREVTFPVAVTWTGYVRPSTLAVVPLSVAVRGTATISIDGRQVIDASSSDRPAVRSEAVALTPGEHRIDVRYLKPAATDPFIEIGGFDERRVDGTLIVTPQPVGSARRAMSRAMAWAGQIADVLAACVFGLALWRLASGRRQGQQAATATRLRSEPALALAAVMFALFLVQGVAAAAPHVHRAVSLSGGDDWLAFEARAREIETGGLLMPFGRPLGAGEVFYYYPGYSYFLAAVHRVTGEDLSGPVLTNFLLLFLANVVVYRIARALFGRPVALGATAGLVVVEEMAFMRHYTPLLLSENLYFLTVPLTLLGLVTFLQDGGRAPLLWAGLAGGASAVTRPAMMLFLVPAVCMLMIAPGRRPLLARAASSGVFVACWFGVVLLITLRNYLMTGSPTLIVESPAHSFILYNLPPTADANQYMRMYSGGLLSAASVLLRIVIDHPLDSLRGVMTKTGFSFGLIQWMGGRVHPELVLASGLYFAALLTSRAARAPITWPIHAFIAAHLLGMILTMPSNYGYRLILPMYLFLPMFGALFIAELVDRVRGRVRVARAIPVRRPS